MPTVPYTYKGFCDWMSANQLPNSSFVDKCRNLSINAKANCLRKDSVKNKMMNIWRGRSAKKWKDGIPEPKTEGIDYDDGLAYTKKELSPEEIDIIVELLRDMSGADDNPTEEENKADKYVQNQQNIMNVLFPVPTESDLMPVSAKDMRSHDPVLQTQMMSSIQDMADNLALDQIYDSHIGDTVCEDSKSTLSEDVTRLFGSMARISFICL